MLPERLHLVVLLESSLQSRVASSLPSAMTRRGRRLQFSRSPYRARRLSLSAFPMTDTELKLMAAAAIIGLSNSPKTG